MNLFITFLLYPIIRIKSSSYDRFSGISCYILLYFSMKVVKISLFCRRRCNKPWLIKHLGVRNQLAHRLTLLKLTPIEHLFPSYSDFSSSSLAIFFFMLMEMAMNLVMIPAWALTEQLAAIKGHHLRVCVCVCEEEANSAAGGGTCVIYCRLKHIFVLSSTSHSLFNS